MNYVLNGFTQELDFRVFAFEGISADRGRTPFRVKIDLALIARYGIRLQDLPLLCRGVLERRDEAEEKYTLTYTESEMRVYAGNAAAAKDLAAQKRRPPRRPVVETATAGVGWRGPRI